MWSETAAPKKRYVHSSANVREPAKITGTSGSDCQPAQHFRQPGTAAGLSSKEVRIIAFDHNRRSREFR